MLEQFDRISRTQDSCRKCGTAFSMEEGVISCIKFLGERRGVACPNCHTIYASEISNGRMVLGDDITEVCLKEKEKRDAAQQAEEKHRLDIQNKRRSQNQCIMCGKPLGFFDKLLGGKHFACKSFME